MKFVLFTCLVFWWLVTAYSAIKSQIDYTKDNGGFDKSVTIKVSDLLGPKESKLFYAIIYSLALITDNILLVIALALSKYANNPDVFHHYLLTLLMLNVVFDFVVCASIPKILNNVKTPLKVRITNGLMDLIILVFGAITIFVGW